MTPSEAMRSKLDYFAHAPNSATLLDGLAALEPTTLACMHGAAWRGDGAVLASDAYFPFPDGLELAAAHGVAAVAQPGDESGPPVAVALPLQPELASPLASPGRRLSRRAGMYTTLAAAVIAGLVIGPLAAPVVGAAVALVAFRPGLRWVLTVGAVGGLFVAVAYIVELQVHYSFPTFLDWPEHFQKVAGLSWVVIAFLLADAVLEFLRSRRRQS